MPLAHYIPLLRKNKLKVTPKRMAVIGLFLSRKRYLSPQEVHGFLRNKFSCLGLPSVYRILEELRGVGILTKVERRERMLYYAICKDVDTRHHHFVCRNCRKVEEVYYDEFSKLACHIAKSIRAKAEVHSMQIEGLCEACK
jgi:Fe2+ or Zn2+ uptake regulation protein